MTANKLASMMETSGNQTSNAFTCNKTLVLRESALLLLLRSLNLVVISLAWDMLLLVKFEPLKIFARLFVARGFVFKSLGCLAIVSSALSLS